MEIEHVGLGRRFLITFSLRSGRGKDEVVFLQSDVERAILGWIAARIAGGKKYLTGCITMANLVGNSNPEERWVGVGTEPQVIFSGVLHPNLQRDCREEEVFAMLQELAQIVGMQILQERIFVEFCGSVYVLKL